jgi:hypothetical protein
VSGVPRKIITMSTPTGDGPTLPTLPSGLRAGAMRNRRDRPVKNGRWYLVGAGVAAKVGWGDLSLTDLHAVGATLPDGWVFLALPESPPGGQHLPYATVTGHAAAGDWCWYDRPDHQPGPDVATLAHAARYAVVAGRVHVVDALGQRSRTGHVWVHPGYRYTRTGRVIRTARVRLPALTPAELLAELAAVAGPRGASLRSVTAFEAYAKHE